MVVNLPGIRHEDFIESNPAIDKSQESSKFIRIRLICKELNDLFVKLEQECSLDTCVEMKAGEWLYLCAAHDEPRSCCAIDYIAHTLEGAQSILNSEAFYCQDHSADSTGKLIQNIARRIFAHCYFHHREIFLDFEDLYKRFLVLTTVDYDMISAKMVTIPE